MQARINSALGKNFDRRERGGAGDGVAAASGSGPDVVRPRQAMLGYDFHQLRPTTVGTDRKAAAQRFAVCHEVGPDAVIFLRAAQRQPEASDDFVED